MAESFSRLPVKFGRYEVRKKLGEGGMGAVFLAKDTVLDRDVALKIPTVVGDDSREVLERLLREARVAAGFQHPNLCPVFDAGEISGTHYIAMPFIEGEPLSASVDAGIIVNPRETALLVAKIARGLHAAHEKGVVHRDLKPANVMIDARGEPVIMDFGLARRSNSCDVRLTQTGAVMGTPAYMSPEQVLGKAKTLGPATDVYSLGVMFYEMLAGRLPYSGSSVASILAQIVSKKPSPPSTYNTAVPELLDGVCLRALEKKPENRFDSALEFAEALEGWIEQPPSGQKKSQKPGLKKSGSKKSQRGQPQTTAEPPIALLLGGGAAALFVILVLVFVVVKSLTRPAADAQTTVATSESKGVPSVAEKGSAQPSATTINGPTPVATGGSPATVAENEISTTDMPRAGADVDSLRKRAAAGDLALLPVLQELGHKVGDLEVAETLVAILPAFAVPENAVPGGFAASPRFRSPPGSSITNYDPQWKILQSLLAALGENRSDRAVEALVDIALQKTALLSVYDSALAAVQQLAQTESPKAATQVANWLIGSSSQSTPIPADTADHLVGALAQLATATSLSTALAEELERHYLAGIGDANTRARIETLLLTPQPDRIDVQVRLLASGKLSSTTRQDLLNSLVALSEQSFREIFLDAGQETAIVTARPQMSSKGAMPGGAMPGALSGRPPGLPSYVATPKVDLTTGVWTREQRLRAASALWTARFAQAVVSAERSQDSVSQQFARLASIPASRSRQEMLALLTGVWKQGPAGLAGSLGTATYPTGKGLSQLGTATVDAQALDATFAASLLDPGVVWVIKQMPRADRPNIRPSAAQRAAAKAGLPRLPTGVGGSVDPKVQESEAKYGWMDATEQLVRLWCARLEKVGRQRSPQSAEGDFAVRLPFQLDSEAVVKTRYSQVWPAPPTAAADNSEPLSLHYVRLESRLPLPRLLEHYLNLIAGKDKPRQRKADDDRWFDLVTERSNPDRAVSCDVLLHKLESLPGAERGDAYRVEVLLIEIGKPSTNY